MAWLTPPNEEGCKSVTLTMPQNAAWFACFMGALLSLTYEYNWEQNTPSDMTPEETSQKWLEIYLAIQNCEGCVITDIRLTATGLEAKYCDSDVWIEKGKLMRYAVRRQNGAIQFDTDGDNYYETNIFENSSTNNYAGGLYPVSDVDKICAVSQLMASDICDDFQDLLQLLDYNTTVISSFVTNVVEKLFTSLPAQIATAELGLVVAAALDIIYEVADATLDYIIIEMGDPDVKNQVAEFLYCALAKSLVTTDGVTDLIDFEENLIQVLGEWFVNINTLGAVDVGFTMDFGEALAGLASAPTIVIAGLACSYVLAEVFFLGSIGLKSEWKTVALGYAGRAEFFSSNECEGFVCRECVNEVLDLTIAQYCTYPRNDISGCSEAANWVEGVGYTRVVCTTGTGPTGGVFARIQVILELAEYATITSIRYKWTGSLSGAVIYNRIYDWSDYPPTITELQNNGSSSGDFTWTGSRSMKEILFIIEAQGTNASPPSSTAILQEIEVRTV